MQVKIPLALILGVLVSACYSPGELKQLTSEDRKIVFNTSKALGNSDIQCVIGRLEEVYKRFTFVNRQISSQKVTIQARVGDSLLALLEVEIGDASSTYTLFIAPNDLTPSYTRARYREAISACSSIDG